MRMTVAAVGLMLLGSVAAAQPPPMEALPQILGLQLDQHPAWRAYKDAAAEDRAAGASEASEAAEINAMATPARLDALKAQLLRRDAAFARQAEATRAFYAVLSPAQRQLFDRVTQLPIPRPPMQPLARQGDGLRLPAGVDGQPLRTPQ